jgi:hypothetical protein
MKSATAVPTNQVNHTSQISRSSRRPFCCGRSFSNTQCPRRCRVWRAQQAGCSCRLSGRVWLAVHKWCQLLGSGVIRCTVWLAALVRSYGGFSRPQHALQIWCMVSCRSTPKKLMFAEAGLLARGPCSITVLGQLTHIVWAKVSLWPTWCGARSACGHLQTTQIVSCLGCYACAQNAP